MASTSISRARIATLAGPGNAARLWPKGRFSRAWVPTYDPYESDDSPSPPILPPTLRAAVSRASVRTDAHERSANRKEASPHIGLGLQAELFLPSLQSTLASALPPVIQRNWAPAPRAPSPTEDYTYEDVFSPMEIALARSSEASYFPSDDDAPSEHPGSRPTATGVTVRSHPPSPIAPMSITGMVSRRPCLQRMPTFASPRVLPIAAFGPEMCTASSSERGARFGLAFGSLLSPRVPRANTPEPVASSAAITIGEGPYMLDDSPFTPSVDVFEHGPVADPVDRFIRDFAVSPGPSLLIGTLPPFDTAEGPVVSPSELELRDFPLTPDVPLDRLAESSNVSRGEELLQKPASPADALFSGDYLFGVYL